jgi:outer membrane biosynthesis protein TonB
MSALSFVLIILGWLLSLVGGVWLLVVAAKQKKYLWMVLIIFVPFAALVYVILNWAEAKKPFFVSLAAIPLLIAGGAMGFSEAMGEAQLAMQEAQRQGARPTRGGLPTPTPEPPAVLPEPTPPPAVVPEPAPTRRPPPPPAPTRTVNPPQPTRTPPARSETPPLPIATPPPVAPAESSEPAAPAPAPSLAPTPAAAPGVVRLDFVTTETPRGAVLRSVRLHITNSFDRAVSKVTFYLGYFDRQGRPLASWTTEHADPEQAVLVGPNTAREFVTPAFFMPDTTTSVRVQLREVKFVDGRIWQPE